MTLGWYVCCCCLSVIWVCAAVLPCCGTRVHLAQLLIAFNQNVYVCVRVEGGYHIKEEGLHGSRGGRPVCVRVEGIQGAHATCCLQAQSLCA